MSLIRKLYNGEADFDWPRAWRRGLVASGVVVVISLVSLLARGLNLGIDFEGGGVWEVPTETASVEDARDALRPLGHGNAKIQIVSDPSGARFLRIQVGVEVVDDSGDVTVALAEAIGVDPDDISINVVGPSWGDEITEKAIRALLLFFLAVAAYISLRLEWKMAVGALVAVAHDIVVSVGVYSVFQFVVTPATVIAFLTILGYSLYDTIVVYDKVRENAARVGVAQNLSYTEMMNLSLNQVLMRSLNTTITSALPVVSLLLIGSLLLGATVLQEFGLALLVGLVAGAYSSLFVATPVLCWLKEREPRNREFRERRERLTGPVPAVAGPEPAAPTVASRSDDQAGPVIPPRPRKKRSRRR